MSESLEIIVKMTGGTYIARCQGKTASCTAGPDHAATAVARKVLGKPDAYVELTQLPEERYGYTRWEVKDSTQTTEMAAVPVVEVQWTKVRPTNPGIYKVRGFNDAKTEAIVNVDIHLFDLVCNLHGCNSSPVDEYDSFIDDLSSDLEWLGPFVIPTPPAQPANERERGETEGYDSACETILKGMAELCSALGIDIFDLEDDMALAACISDGLTTVAGMLKPLNLQFDREERQLRLPAQTAAPAREQDENARCPHGILLEWQRICTGCRDEANAGAKP